MYVNYVFFFNWILIFLAEVLEMQNEGIPMTPAQNVCTWFDYKV